MKAQPAESPRRGAALIVTLILVTAIALVVVSYFAIARQEVSLSGADLARTRASFGEKAAFAEATARLRRLTANDGYFVTIARTGSGGAKGPSRYTFVTIVDSDGVTHTPLFAGGRETAESLPAFNEIETTALANEAVAAPPVAFEEETRDDLIKLPRLTGLDTDGKLEEENARPPLGVVELPASDETPWRTRYTYWVEDLEGYPNLDLVGARIGGDGDAAVRFGYAAHDSRALADSAVFSLPGADQSLYRFPSEHRGQSLVDQVAPGLSPREITLQPWPVAGLAPERHPYAAAANLAAERHRVAGARYPAVGEDWREPARYSSGLRPYRTVPLIPYGHGYVDQGQPRFNLNTLVAKRDIGIADIVERNLPAFKERRGGLPPAEDYLATLAANAIDYADPDGLPARPDNTSNANGRVFRGVDGYCPVNELFVRFEYRGYEDDGAEWIAVFVATLHAEFWNPFNCEVTMENVRLKFGFIEPFRFKTNTKSHFIEDKHIDRNEPFVLAPSILVAPAEYKIHRLGEVRWKVPIPKEDGPIAFPVVQDFRAEIPGESSRVDVRAHYELWLGGELDGNFQWIEKGDFVDSSGRRGAAPRIEYGFFFPRYQPALSSGEFFTRFAVPGLALSGRGSPQPFGSLLGDPWMNYYSASTSEAALYKNKATPGSRNFDRSKVGKRGKGELWFKDGIRVRDWPDRGYDAPSIPGPTSDEDSPDNSRFHWTPEPAYAPWRLSQLGVYHTVTELGNLHDPVMWTYVPPSMTNPVKVTNQKTQLYNEVRDTWLRGIHEDAGASDLWGGGNTLRIGRAEHPGFDQPGMRASQWLDLFHVGYTGSNLLPPGGDPVEPLYRHHDPVDHQPPPAAPGPAASTNHPYALLYDPKLNAQGRYALVHGHLNLNTAPTRFEIETLLRGPSVSSDLRLKNEDDFAKPEYEREGETGVLRGALSEVAIPAIAEGLMAARPFYSPSHLARVLSELIERHDGLPDHHNDAEAEEPFARLFNTTTLSSRHFRIHTAAEVYHANSGEVVGRARRVYEVFLRPEHDADGKVARSRLETISSREL